MSTQELDAIAVAIRDGLGSGGPGSLTALLDGDVTWGFCQGRDDVTAFIEAAGGTRPDATEVIVAEDRILIELRFEAGSVHLAAFVRGGSIAEICDANDADHARTLQPIGGLDEAAHRPARLTGAAAVFPVADIDRASDLYRALGFTVEAYSGDAPYAFAARDGVDLHLAQFVDLDPNANTSAVYLYVDDAVALYARWRAAGVPGRLMPPRDTDYGLREGSYTDPDGNLLRFGSPN